MTGTQERTPALDEVAERLRRARRAWRVTDVAGGLLRGLTLLLAALLAGVLADNLLSLPAWLRLGFGMAFAACAVYLLLVRTVLNLWRPLSDEMVAVHVENAASGVENRLINAVLLRHEHFDDPVTRQMVASQMDETVHVLNGLERGVRADRALLWKWGRWSAGLGALTLVYGLGFSGYFVNALHRYALPTRYVPPITGTRLEVSPGHAEALQGESVAVEARVEGVLPEKAWISIEEEGAAPARHAMPFEGNCFSWTLRNVQKSVRYRVAAGDAVSDTFDVIVRTRPSIRETRAVTVFPAYMRLPDKIEKTQAGNFSAPVGATVRIEAVADRTLSTARCIIHYLRTETGQDESAEMPMELKDNVATLELTVARSGQYRIEATDAAGIANQPVTAQLVALPDDPPLVKVPEPGKDVAVEPTARVALLAQARDDFSLNGLTLYVQIGAGAEWKPLRDWKYKPGTRETPEGAVLDVQQFNLPVGGVLSYCFRGDDGAPARDDLAGRSRVYQVTILDPSVAHEKEQAQEQALRARINRLIALQKTNLEATRQAVREAGDVADSAVRERHAVRVAPLVKAQEQICAEARDAVRGFSGIESTDMLDALASIAAREMPAAIERLDALRAAASPQALVPAGAGAVAAEEEIIRLLERLLQDAKGLLSERLLAEAPKEQVADKFEDMDSRKQRVEKTLEALKKFQEEQREAIKMTQKLTETAPADFTKEDEKALENIIDMEQKWAKFFQEAATDLSKLPPQDHSLPNMAKELLEVFSEIKKAADAAEKQAVEIAVPLEQAGLELAEKIETNLEKWLLETPDREAWKMEDPIADADVPIVELPDELEDMIGELMEEEEDLLEEAEDATSGWLDSLDKGVGWGAADGPISSMSAKGVTGNRLPDVHEVAGRSGEGRTGKSSGQFVEESASGKGGRTTPTRLTEDPYEAGTVKDTSPEAATGSTGGGKSSGLGQEGLRGQPPPRVQEQLKRMANQQQQLIEKAQRVDFGLQKLGYPRGELPKTIELMEQIQSRLAAGQPVSTAGAQQKVVLGNLREVKEVVARQKHVNREKAAMLPHELRDEITSSLREDVPKQYKEQVENYYKALSEMGAAK